MPVHQTINEGDFGFEIISLIYLLRSGVPKFGVDISTG